MSSPKPLRLLTVEIRFEQDVVLARQRARQLAGLLGFEARVQTRIATAVSEIARNAFQYARGGRTEFSVLTEPHPADVRRIRQTLLIEVQDSGPGIARLEEILAGSYRSPSGLGLGIIGTKRLVDRVEISSSPGGAHVSMACVLPPSVVPRTAVQIQAIVDELSRLEPVGAVEEIQVQNQELLLAMEDSRLRQEELTRVNQELADTNAGVLALYDELDTLHRISVMLASKVELRPLIESIVDVTTSLTDASIGAFFFREEDGQWLLYAKAGPSGDCTRDLPSRFSSDLFGADFAIAEVAPGTEPPPPVCAACGPRLAEALAGMLEVRSCLTVPVLESNHTLIGAFLFASGQQRAFGERIERILASVATQAAVGIEKARLFQTVTAASDAKDQFFATLSHELRTPLNPALAIVSSLHGDPRIPPELREDIAIVARNIRLEARLIDDLLDFNRLIKGKLQLATDVVDLHAMIENVLQICREDLEAKQHHSVLELHATNSAVVGDAARLQQVLWNVVKNAVKFTPAGGSIYVRTRTVGRLLRVDITDTGRGIEPAEIGRIFNAFDQGQTRLAAHFGGLGLGLTIARMFVDLHHGEIFASSEGLGKGATITIELPTSEAPARERSGRESGLSAPKIGNGRILLVDDHPDTLKGLARLLERRGFTVSSAVCGEAAVAAARSETFDLLISDVGLPDCSGHQLVARVCAIQKIPSIALSGYGMEADLVASYEAGFQVHLTKPVDFQQLIDAVDLLLSKAAKPVRA